ncbi:prepilin peptidase [Sphingomonas glaciei]|uniref:Prepilin leader peptidase/N-methyltransferase n=1 Tax=Sphingomonas glaciei TaxID=2938948 RepID=A0ABY5MV92_9SPHN|nr:A24 family peptidase [Sphingomonas glaciei]UUR08367.1 A24 family peptidase [Sphingomonas glaciei]
MIPLAGGVAGFLLGAIFGSFIATLCLRWPEGESVLRGRSTCDGCGRPIPPARLVPLLSAAWSRGGAACCGSAIDPFHTRVELAAALIGAVSLALAPSAQGLALAAFGWLLLPLFLLDRAHFWLPNPLTITLALAGFALAPLLDDVPLVERLASSLVAGLGLALIGWTYARLRSREGLGGGDPKLLAALALWLGAEGVVATLLGAALLGLAVALAQRRARDEALPFGAFLCLAAWLIATLRVAFVP